MPELIEIPVKAGEKEHILKFTPLSVVDATEWGSRMKARATYRESLERQIKAIEKISELDRDMDEYFALVDKEAKVLKSIAEVTLVLSKFIVEPDREIVEKLLLNHLEEMIGAFTKFMGKLFPSEADKKKS